MIEVMIMSKIDFAVHDVVNSNDIKAIRKKLKLTQQEFANLVKVSKKTIEKWEYANQDISGPIVCLLKIINNYPQIIEQLKIPEKKYPIRIKYMFKNELCTIIDVNEIDRKIEVYNFTTHVLMKAFGVNENPNYQEYEDFLESRCFPRERDKMKLILKELDIPFYDPIMIIEKTKGRMAEDDFWIEIER